MKAHIRTKHGTFEADGATPKDLFKKMAAIHEVFSEDCCGICGNESIRMVVRPNKKGNLFFEYQCQDYKCGGYLSVGQSEQKPGELFPVRKLMPNGKPSFKEGDFGKTNGWTTYRGE